MSAIIVLALVRATNDERLTYSHGRRAWSEHCAFVNWPPRILVVVQIESLVVFDLTSEVTYIMVVVIVVTVTR